MKKPTSISLCLALVITCLFGNLSASAATTKPAKPTLAFLTKAVYDEVGQYSEGLVWVREGNLVQYLDANGRVAISPDKLKKLEKKLSDDNGGEISRFIYGDFHNGLALLEDEPGSPIHLFFDKKGAVVNCGGERPFSFSEGLSFATAAEDGYISLNDTKGKTVAEANCIDKFGAQDSENSYSYDFYVHVFNGLLPIMKFDGDTLAAAGYLDTKLNLAIPFKFQNAKPFNNGIAPAKSNGKWGFINTKGDFVIKPQFDDFSVSDSKYSYVVFNEGLAAVKRNGKWGYIDKKGNTVIPFNIVIDSTSYPSPFIDGKAIVIKNGKRGYIDKKGKAIVPYIYDDANYFYKGAALVGKAGQYKLIDGTGKTVSAQTWKFQGTMVYNDCPNYAFYKQNGKWGIAKITK